MGSSALHRAAQSGVVDVARLLLDRGVFIDLQSLLVGHMPLFDAVCRRYRDDERFVQSLKIDHSSRLANS